MSLIYETRLSDSPYVETITRGCATGDSSVIRPAESHWHIIVVRQQGNARLLVTGSLTTAGVVSWTAGTEFLWIKFKLGTFMPHLPARDHLNSEMLLPGAASQSFWLQGSAWQFPDYENGDTFVDRLVREQVFYQTCSGNQLTLTKGIGITMDMKLEVVAIPVADVDRAITFYVDKVGFHLDHDVQPGNGMRVVQLTPPGSACSIVMGTGMAEIAKMQPGSVKALHLVVADAGKAREMLINGGVAASEVEDLGRGIKHVSFSDPDGNSWVFQELPWRTPEFNA